VILVEQRIDRCFHLADRIIFMEDGRIKKQGKSQEMVQWIALKDQNYVPPIAQLFSTYNMKEIPLTIKEGRAILKSMAIKASENPYRYEEESSPVEAMEIMVLSNLYATYNSKDFVLNKIDM